MAGTGSVNESINGSVNDGVNVISNSTNDNVLNVLVNNLFADQAIVDTGSFLSIVDNNFCK